jgi:hypothetical protein
VNRLRTFFARLRGLVTARRWRHEFDQEVANHLDLLAETFRREGMTVKDARCTRSYHRRE